jgi:hypothetical protein
LWAGPGYHGPPASEGEYLRFATLMQVLGLLVLAAVAVVAVTGVVDDWSDWVVFGGIIVAVVGFTIAIHRRQYPTRKRAFTRDEHSNW